MTEQAHGKVAIGEAVAAVRAHTTATPKLALILGSGMGDLAEGRPDALAIPSADIPGYPASAVHGHAGRLVFSELAGCQSVFVQGRVHRYEGHSLEAVTFPVRLVAALGAQFVLITNAAGGVNAAFTPGTLMWIDSHIDWTGPRPDLREPHVERGEYDADWLRQADRNAGAAGIVMQRGTYLWTSGPSFETKAEIRAFRSLGADAVGMSTVPEVRAARQAGLRVLGMSTITNPAAGLSDGPLGHEEVMETGRQVRQTLERLVTIVAGGVSGLADQ